jgi:hypothetical protein
MKIGVKMSCFIIREMETMNKRKTWSQNAGAIDKREKAITHSQLLTKTRYGGRETKLKTRFLLQMMSELSRGRNQSSSCFSAMYKGYIYKVKI